eukprot:SAG11_NODE_10918_length_796_cov_1.586801_1_plen_22_part_10
MLGYEINRLVQGGSLIGGGGMA